MMLGDAKNEGMRRKAGVHKKKKLPNGPPELLLDYPSSPLARTNKHHG